jgi:Icc-related predicted phosphoesterase
VLRALCLSDLHLDLASAARLGARALGGGIGLVLSAGDLGLDGKNDRSVYAALARAGVPVLSVPGNHDGDRLYEELVRDLGWIDLHGRVVEHAGWFFAGWGLNGWDGETPSEDDPPLAALLGGLAAIPPDRLVLVTHLPPSETLASRDRHFVDRGHPLLAAWIARVQPAACVSGHVHHREPVVDSIGRTLVVNAGPHGYVLERKA